MPGEGTLETHSCRQLQHPVNIVFIVISFLRPQVKPPLSAVVMPSVACLMDPQPLSSVCARVPQTWQGQPGSTGSQSPVGMLQSPRADGEPWEASAYWGYPRIEDRNIKLFHGSLCLMWQRAAWRVSRRCAHWQGVCCWSPLPLQGVEKRKGQ